MIYVTEYSPFVYKYNILLHGIALSVLEFARHVLEALSLAQIYLIDCLLLRDSRRPIDSSHRSYSKEMRLECRDVGMAPFPLL